MTTSSGPGPDLVHLGGLEHLRRPELPHHHRTHDGASLIGANLSDSDLIGMFYSE